MCQWTRRNIECFHDFLVLRFGPCSVAVEERSRRRNPNYFCSPSDHSCQEEAVPFGTICQKCHKTHTTLKGGYRSSLRMILSQYNSSTALPRTSLEQPSRPQSGLDVLAGAALVRRAQELYPRQGNAETHVAIAQASSAQQLQMQQAAVLPGHRVLLPDLHHGSTSLPRMYESD